MKKFLRCLYFVIFAVFLVACNNSVKSEFIEGSSNIELCIGDTFELDYTITGGEYDVFYSEYDDEIINISNSGIVEGIKAGETSFEVTIVMKDKKNTTYTYAIFVNVSRVRYVTISFRSNIDGVIIEDSKIRKGNELELPSAPKVERYDFVGYKESLDDTEYITKITPEENKILYAIYERNNSMLVNFVVNGEKQDYSFETTKGSSFDLSKYNLSEKGFLGWIDSNKTPSIINGNVYINDDTTFIAVFDKNEYEINYDFNGGSWERVYYTIDELAKMYIDDFNRNGGSLSAAIDIDTAHIDSSVFANIYSTPDMMEKWGWLYNALWVKAGKPLSKDPSSCDMKGTDAKSFYISHICGFLTRTLHGDSNYSTKSVDYSDIANLKEVLYQATPKEEYPGPSKYNKGSNLELAKATKNGYVFKGWSFDGINVIDKIESDYIGDLTLKAVWEETIKPNLFVINNLDETGLELYTPLKLDYTVYPIEANNKTAYFQSLNTKVFTVDDDGNIFPLSKGQSQLRVIFEDNPEYELLVDINVIATGYFKISYDSNSYVKVNDKIKLNASYVDGEGNEQSVKFTSLNNDIISADSNGFVTGIKEGIGKVRASYNDKEIDFVITVISEELSEELEFILENHNSNASVSYNLGIGAGNPVYYYDAIGSVNNLLFDKLKIDKTYYDTLPSGKKNYGPMDSVEFITVHYTGSMSYGADADNTCSYFNEPSYEASIHFVTGRSNLSQYGNDWSIDSYAAFAGLNELYGGWHASTGKNQVVWDKTGIKVEETDPEKPVISISSNLKYTINGKESIISIPNPPSGYKINGNVLNTGSVTTSVFNDYGLVTKIIDNEYYLARTYWGSQRSPQALCTYGGNTNSIGIESCVDMGSDLMHTWHVTAQLVASLLVKYNLSMDRVVGHHFFSGKNCPQPLLLNDMKLWCEFLDMVKAEYDLITKYNGLTINMKVVEGEDNLNRLGLTKQDRDAHIVTYEVEVIKDGKSEKITLATAIESNLSCDCLRDEASLQITNFEIK